jgi:hypothetical protein
MKTAVMKVNLLLYLGVEGGNELSHHFAAVCAFEQRFFDGKEEGIDFRTHRFTDVSNLGLPVTVMENADKGLSRAGLEMLLLAEIYELRACSQTRIAGRTAAVRFQGDSLKFVCHNVYEVTQCPRK